MLKIQRHILSTCCSDLSVPWRFLCPQCFPSCTTWVVQLDAFQLVLVGTVQETSCFLFEMPTGVVADLYSRRRSVLIGMFLYGLGFLMEGALPWFAPVLLAQVVWGCGDTFITGALEAWIASEEEDKPIDKVFLRGSQMGQIGGVLGVVLGTLLGNINLQMPLILGAVCACCWGW